MLTSSASKGFVVDVGLGAITAEAGEDGVSGIGRHCRMMWRGFGRID